MPDERTDGSGGAGGGAGEARASPFERAFDLEELRRRNRVAVGMDVLYLVTTGFFAVLANKGLWPAAIAAVPLAALLYFGWSSSKPFFIGQLLAIGLALALDVAGLMPL